MLPLGASPTSTFKMLGVCTFIWACHLHFWQYDRVLYRAAAVTRGWVITRRGENPHSSDSRRIQIRPPPCPVLSEADFTAFSSCSVTNLHSLKEIPSEKIHSHRDSNLWPHKFSARVVDHWATGPPLSFPTLLILCILLWPKYDLEFTIPH